jgi:hypothetical protein
MPGDRLIQPGITSSSTLSVRATIVDTSRKSITPWANTVASAGSRSCSVRELHLTHRGRG